MDEDFTTCRVCGRFVLQIAGWTSVIPSYWLMRATWDQAHPFFHGALHFPCLPRWEHREAFQSELTDILTGRGRTIAVATEGTEHALSQPGFYYSERIFADADSAIYRHTATDRWLVLSTAGPWVTLGAEQLRALGRGRPARADEGAERVVLPRDPGPEISAATLGELLDFLAVRDLYQEALEQGSPDYQLWGYHPRKRVIEYSVGIDLPLPDSAGEFLARYALDYQPLSFDDE